MEQNENWNTVKIQLTNKIIKQIPYYALKITSSINLNI